MEDHYFFSGLDDGEWFASRFREYQHFEYVGDSDRLKKRLSEKSFARSFVEILGSKLSLSDLLLGLLGRLTGVSSRPQAEMAHSPARSSSLTISKAISTATGKI